MATIPLDAALSQLVGAGAAMPASIAASVSASMPAPVQHAGIMGAASSSGLPGVGASLLPDANKKKATSSKPKCPHGRKQYYCRECGGAGICKPHGKSKRPLTSTVVEALLLSLPSPLHATHHCTASQLAAHTLPCVLRPPFLPNRPLALSSSLPPLAPSSSAPLCSPTHYVPPFLASFPYFSIPPLPPLHPP